MQKWEKEVHCYVTYQGRTGVLNLSKLLDFRKNLERVFCYTEINKRD